jgi:DNA-binding response OmpR family regulator
VNLAIKMVLEENRFKVDSFTDPVLTFENFRKEAGIYDLLMVDIKMPNMNGALNYGNGSLSRSGERETLL